MDEVKKTCFKCGRELPLDEFYKHPAMKDGHLNKCKDCTKRDMKVQYEKNIESPEYIEKERERGREKYRRYRYGTAGNSSEKRREKNHRFPSVRSTKARMHVVTDAGMDLHHWNYKLQKNVILLPRNIHHRLHQQITLDLGSGMYSRGGVLLDTIEKHMDVVRDVCTAAGYDFNRIAVL